GGCLAHGPGTPALSPLSLHDALPISLTDDRVADAERSLKEMLGRESLAGLSFLDIGCGSGLFSLAAMRLGASRVHSFDYDPVSRSEEHTSELQSRRDLVCRLLLEKKK